LKQSGSVHQAEWPAFDEALAADEEVTIVIQVDGKLRDRIQMAAGASEAALREAAVTNEKAQSTVGARSIQEVVVVPGRLVNIVTG
jgi:leucyl-tRNA synthetase